MDIEKLIRDNIRALAPYSTARDDYSGEELGIFLDANENPYESSYNRYPDPHQAKLKGIISNIKGVGADHIFLGNGSDEPIDLLYRVFCDPAVHNAISISPTYGMYRVAADINNIEMREVALREDFSLDREAMLAACDNNSRLMFLCSPNNPTGNLLDRGDVEYLLRHFEGIVVIDEAYIDFADDEGFVGRLSEFENLVVLQTLSKAWGMAGLRVGLAFASEYIVGLLSKVKYPYNLGVVTQKIVEEQLGKPIESMVREIVEERRRVSDILEAVESVERVYPSDANFLLVKVKDARGMYGKLIEDGIIVRDRSRVRGCEGCLRITIGLRSENDLLVEALGVW